MLKIIMAALVFVTSIAFAVDSRAESEAFEVFKKGVEKELILNGIDEKWEFKELQEKDGRVMVEVYRPANQSRCTFLYDHNSFDLFLVECYAEKPKTGV